MPTYQYACTDCEHAFEQVQSFSDDALTECPQCEGRLRKLFNAVGVVFKGSGFYRTDSRADARSAAGGSSGNGSSSSSGSSGTSDGSGSGESSTKTPAKSGSESSGSGSSGSGEKKTTAAAS